MSLSLLKKLGVLTAFLFLLLGIYLYRQVPRSTVPFKDPDSKAQRMILEQGHKKVEIIKQGKDWKVVLLAGTRVAADESRIVSLLSSLKNVELENEISDRPDRAADYDVNTESGTIVRLFGEKDVKLGEGLFGKQAPDYSHTYFKYLDRPNVYLARGLYRGELGSVDVNSWRRRMLVDIPEDKILAITMEGKGFKTDLVRISTDVWTMNGSTVASNAVNVIVGMLAHLQFSDFVDAAADPNLTYEGLTLGRVIVKGPDSTAELKIGAEDAKSKRYPVATSREEGLVWLSESLVQSLQQRPTAFPAKR